MPWTGYMLGLSVGMLVTGSISTLAVKWADMQKAPGCENGNHPEPHPFDHPFLQTVSLFIAEFASMIVFQTLRCIRRIRRRPTYNMGNQDFSPFLLFIPAMCDMIATSVMYVGLNLTYASSFQMLRGAVIVFTAMLSVTFLRRIVTNKMWFGIFSVVVGLLLVGLSDVFFPDAGESEIYGKNGIITGDLIIVIAQVAAAAQSVVEEKYVAGKDINPLQAVGWEGFFGMTTLSILLVPMYYIIIGNDNGSPKRMADAMDGLCQLKHDWRVALGTFGNIFVTAFFKCFAISIIKERSATTRMVIDSIRTVVIWVVTLALRWETFQYLQLIGFLILLFGTSVYNNLISVGYFKRKFFSVNATPGDNGDDEDEKAPILPTINKEPSYSEA